MTPNFQQRSQLAARPFPISPLSLDSLTRDYYGAFDAAIIAQLAPLAHNECYQPKIYRAPALSNEVVPAAGYVSHGMKITPGSIIYGYFLPPSLRDRAAAVNSYLPGAFNVQIRDQSLKHEWFDQPVPSYFLANDKPAYYSASQDVLSSFPNLLDAPYPVVGNGLFLVEIWNTLVISDVPTAQRIELVFGVLEPIGEACL